MWVGRTSKPLHSMCIISSILYHLRFSNINKRIYLYLPEYHWLKYHLQFLHHILRESVKTYPDQNWTWKSTFMFQHTFRMLVFVWIWEIQRNFIPDMWPGHVNTGTSLHCAGASVFPDIFTYLFLSSFCMLS